MPVVQVPFSGFTTSFRLASTIPLNQVWRWPSTRRRTAGSGFTWTAAILVQPFASIATETTPVSASPSAEGQQQERKGQRGRQYTACLLHPCTSIAFAGTSGSGRMLLPLDVSIRPQTRSSPPRACSPHAHGKPAAGLPHYLFHQSLSRSRALALRTCASCLLPSHSSRPPHCLPPHLHPCLPPTKFWQGQWAAFYMPHHGLPPACLHVRALLLHWNHYMVCCWRGRTLPRAVAIARTCFSKLPLLPRSPRAHCRLHYTAPPFHRAAPVSPGRATWEAGGRALRGRQHAQQRCTVSEHSLLRSSSLRDIPLLYHCACVGAIFDKHLVFFADTLSSDALPALTALTDLRGWPRGGLRLRCDVGYADVSRRPA